MKKMRTGPLFSLLLNASKKIIVCQGGGDAGKTVTILQVLAVICTSQRNRLCTVVGQDMPNLKSGALESFQKYVAKHPQIRPWIQSYNKTNFTYYFITGSRIQFKAFENEQDARGGERDYLFVNEANAIPYAMFWQLQRKTRVRVFLDYNPTSRFWVHEKVLAGATQDRQYAERVQRYIVDHRHNPFLSKEDHEAYESIEDPDMFKVYARGLTGKIKGLIFGHMQPVEEFPRGCERIIWGIDYGYTTDPTTIIKIGVIGRNRYWQEKAYQKGDMEATEIRAVITSDPDWRPDQAIYSEADPNMINQLRVLGMAVMPAIKGPGSKQAGISKVRKFGCYYTRDSKNIEREKNSYKWVMAEDLATGKEIMTNQPMDGDDHTLDAGRQAIYTDAIRTRAA
jgi:phage terminase large subunit